MSLNVIVLQRVIPHYRLALFERLYNEFGWIVVTSSGTPNIGPLRFNNLVCEDLPFIKRYDFEWPSKTNGYRCNIPVRAIIDDTGADAVIAEFSMYMDSTYLLPLIRRVKGSPKLLFWSHGFNMDRGLTSARQRILQWPRALLSAMADGHICYSEEGRNYLSRFMGGDRLFVAPNTLDAGTLRREAGEITPMEAPGRPHLLAVGRMTADKDFARLVRIFRALLADFPGAALTVVGDGPAADQVRAAAGDELGRTIFLPGAEYNESRIAGYHESADLCVLTGAAGLGVNHALCYGLPIVAYERTAEGPHHHPEIAYVVDGVTGVRVPHYTDAAMLQTLRELLSRCPDPKAAFRDSINRYVAEHLSLDSMIAAFAKAEEFLRRRMRNRSASSTPAADPRRS